MRHLCDFLSHRRSLDGVRGEKSARPILDGLLENRHRPVGLPGYYASRSKTWKVIVFVGIMPVDGDVAKALQAVDAIKLHALATSQRPIPYRFIDVSAKPMPRPILEWENKIDYWRQLHAVIQAETVPAEFRSMFGMLASLGIEQGKPFNPRRPHAAHS